MVGTGLYIRHAGAINRAVRAVSFHIGITEQDFEDFSQDVHLRYLSGADKLLGLFNGWSAIDTYLFISIRRYAIWWKKRRCACQLVYFKTGLDDVPEVRLRSDDALEFRHHHGAARRLHVALQRAFASLSRESQALICRRFICGHRATEIATGVGLTNKTIYRRCDRALAQLRRSLVKSSVTGDAIYCVLEALRDNSVNVATMPPLDTMLPCASNLTLSVFCESCCRRHSPPN